MEFTLLDQGYLTQHIFPSYIHLPINFIFSLQMNNTLFVYLSHFLLHIYVSGYLG